MNTNDYKLIEGKPYFSGDYVLKREQEIKRLKQKAQDDYENYQEIMSQVLEQKDRLNNILKALEKGIVPPTINYKEKDEECDLDIVPNEPRKADLKIVMSNSLGFGGHNACIVMKKFSER